MVVNLSLNGSLASISRTQSRGKSAPTLMQMSERCTLQVLVNSRIKETSREYFRG